MGLKQHQTPTGLDTSNGLELVQQRIGLFAKIIALIAKDS